jgi:hypothetical protein
LKTPPFASDFTFSMQNDFSMPTQKKCRCQNLALLYYPLQIDFLQLLPDSVQPNAKSLSENRRCKVCYGSFLRCTLLLSCNSESILFSHMHLLDVFLLCFLHLASLFHTIKPTSLGFIIPHYQANFTWLRYFTLSSQLYLASLLHTIKPTSLD